MIRKNKNRFSSYKIHMFSEDISNAIQFSIPEYRNDRQNIKIENLDFLKSNFLPKYSKMFFSNFVEKIANFVF